MRGLSNPGYKLPKINVKKLNPKEILRLDSEVLYNLGKDDPRRSPVIDGIITKREFADVTDRWIKKRFKCKATRLELNKQWFILHQCEQSFRETVITHNKFIRRNLDKRLRAIQKTEQAQESIKIRQANIDMLAFEAGKARLIAKEMRKQINTLDLYEIFLIQTIEHESSPYRTINDLLNKFQTLHEVRAKRQGEQNQESTNVVEAYQATQNMIIEKNFCLVGLRNELNEKRVLYEELIRRKAFFENLVTTIITRIHEVASEVVSCYYLIDTIYRNICIRKKERPEALTIRQYQPKLEYIKRTLEGWRRILRKWATN